jgi:hypothetical protein
VGERIGSYKDLRVHQSNATGVGPRQQIEIVRERPGNGAYKRFFEGEMSLIRTSEGVRS